MKRSIYPAYVALKSASTRVFRGILRCTLLLSLSACTQIGYLFEDDPEPDPCDNEGGFYIKGQHYIGRDFVKDDGTMDYNKWFESRKIQSSRCDPLRKEEKNEPRP